MRPERRKRADGTEIDGVKNLAEFVQSFPASAEEPAPESAQAAPQTAPPEPPPAIDTAELERLRAEAKQHRDEAARLTGELQAERTRKEAEAAARRVYAEQQPKPAPQSPQPPQEDPRYAEVDALWFTDQQKARKIMREIQHDELKKELAEQRNVVKGEVFAELTAKQQKQQVDYAYSASMQKLLAMGVPPENINIDRINAVYATITRKPTPNAPNRYYENGSIMNENVIVEAWKDLYGVPNGGAGASQAPVVAPPTQVAVPAPPPGSSKPAPAATPPRNANDRLPALSADMKRDLEHIATTLGHDPEKLMQRRRERIARERG